MAGLDSFYQELNDGARPYSSLSATGGSPVQRREIRPYGGSGRRGSFADQDEDGGVSEFSSHGASIIRHRVGKYFANIVIMLFQSSFM